jgi:hypothetical protein
VKESSEEYRHFLETLKEAVVLDVLSGAILSDRRDLLSCPLKLRESWIRVVDFLNVKIQAKLAAARKELRQIDAWIIETRQMTEHREVSCRWKGYIYREKWLNEWLKAECIRQMDRLIKECENST